MCAHCRSLSGQIPFQRGPPSSRRHDGARVSADVSRDRGRPPGRIHQRPVRPKHEWRTRTFCPGRPNTCFRRARLSAIRVWPSWPVHGCRRWPRCRFVAIIGERIDQPRRGLGTSHITTMPANNQNDGDRTYYQCNAITVSVIVLYGLRYNTHAQGPRKRLVYTCTDVRRKF